MNDYLVAGDIGGTKIFLALADKQGTILREQRFESSNFSNLINILDAFMPKNLTILSACFGVAGPIINQQVKITNLPWEIKTNDLQTYFNCKNVNLINDFAAIGYGMSALHPRDTVSLQNVSAQPAAPRLILGAGTDLGMAIVSRGQILPSETSHATFAPDNALQRQLVEWALPKIHRVTNGYFLSGMGLTRLYAFTCETQGFSKTYQCAADISRAALLNADLAAMSALQLFVEIYGSITGNLALSCLPFGGIFIAGGIAPKILPALQSGVFIKAFSNKPPMSNLLENMPVSVIVTERVGLLGALQQAVSNL
jgi:glucokinase